MSTSRCSPRSRTKTSRLVTERAAAIREVHGLSDLWLSYRDPGGIVLQRIAVAPEHQGEGRAERALRDVCALGDELGVPVGLTPSGIYGADKVQLAVWYMRHGFRWNDGSVGREREAMVRPPVKQK